MATPKLLLEQDQSCLYVNCGSASEPPMQTLSFPVKEFDGEKFVLFQDYTEAEVFLGEWFGIEPTASYDDTEGNNMVELAYIMACNTIAHDVNGTIPFDDWTAGFKPIDTPNGAEGDYIYAMSGQDFELVKQAFETDPKTVWTVMDDDGALTIASGIRRVNSLGYSITMHPEGKHLAHVFEYDDFEEEDAA